MRVIVVGSSVAGVCACGALRTSGFDGDVVLLGGEDCPPYDRPPLSKQLLLGAVTPADIALPDGARLQELAVERRAGTVATGLDLAAREVVLAGGARLAYDGLILATGSNARRLPDQPPAAGIHVLRTLDDAIGLKRDFAVARHVVVIGAGFIGLEVASSARALGIDVTILETGPSPMARVFPADIGEWFTELHAGFGVSIRCRAAVTGFEIARGRVVAVRLADGDSVAADVVVVGIGAVPATDWLRGSGLTLDDGVVCDAALRAAAGVYAAGDVARWEHPLFGPVRVEHWTTARDHARTAAWNLTAELDGRPGDVRVAAEVPYFWSDQHNTKIQMTGWSAGHDRMHALRGNQRRAVLFGRDGVLVGAMTWNWAALVGRQRRAVDARAPWDEAIAAVADFAPEGESW